MYVWFKGFLCHLPSSCVSHYPCHPCNTRQLQHAPHTSHATPALSNRYTKLALAKIKNENIKNYYFRPPSTLLLQHILPYQLSLSLSYTFLSFHATPPTVSGQQISSLTLRNWQHTPTAEATLLYEEVLTDIAPCSRFQSIVYAIAYSFTLFSKWIMGHWL